MANDDVLLNLIAKHKEAAGVKDETPAETTPVFEEEQSVPTVEQITPETPTEEEDIYGVGDLMKEIEAEDKAAAEARAQAIAANAAAKANVKKELTMPDAKRNDEYLAEVVDYQGNKVGAVTGMVNRVVAKYRLVSGGIVDVPTEEQIAMGILGKRHVMGELMNIYDDQLMETASPLITPEFESVILSNWIMPDGTRAIDNINEGGVVIDSTMVINNNVPEPQPEKTTPVEEKEVDPPANITINVEPNTPVAVNVDNELVGNITRSKQVNIYVKEISNTDVEAETIIENTDKIGIISKYDSGINDVPVTLPMSGYRCVLRGINYLDFIKLSTPTSGNAVDAEIRRWTIIYNHLKNPSIGDFTDFEDFLRKTKYQDREILMWGILAATLDEKDNIEITCGNPNCKDKHLIEYVPRELLHIDESRIPEWYIAAGQCGVGQEAINVWEQAAGKRVKYTLPDSKVQIEINEPSAYEFITQKLTLLDDLYKRYNPDHSFTEDAASDENFIERADLIEFNYLSSIAMYVSAANIKSDGKIYRYTLWKDIENIISNTLSGQDSAILLQLVSEVRTNATPASFRINDVTCPKCKHHDDYIPIENIQEQLLVQVFMKLGNTQINLIKQD